MAIIPSILIVDDDPKTRRTLSDILNARGYAATTAGQGKTALDMVKEQAPDVILIDLKLEDMPGLEVMKKIKKRSPGMECIVLTGYATQASAIEAVNLGAYGYVQKPCDVEQLLAMIHRAIEKRQAEEALRESEAKYSVLVEQAKDAVFIVQDDVYSFVNTSFGEITGYTVEEILGTPFLDIVAPESRALVAERYRLRMAGKEVPSVYEIKIQCKDGTLKEVEISPRIIQYRGRPANMGIGRDITERKRAEEELKAAEEYARNLIDSSLDMIISVDQDRRIAEFNQAAQETFGYSKAEVLGKHVDLLYADPTEGLKVHQTARRTGRFTGEILNKRKNGQTFPCSVSASAMRDAEGNFLGVMGVSRDITERKRAEEALRESEARFRLLAENMTDVISVTDMAGRPTYMSPSVTRLYGFSVEEAMNRTPEESLTPASLEVVAEAFAAEIAIGDRGGEDRFRARTRELEAFRKDGSTVWVEASVSFLRDSNGRPVEILSVVRDITKRKRAEEALHESEENFRALAENAIDGILISLDEGGHVYANKRAAKITDYTVPELRKTSFKDLAHPDEWQKIVERYQRRLEGKRVPRWYETVIVQKDGESVPIELGEARTVWHGKPADMLIIRDITERKQAEEALRESEERFRNIYAESPIAIELCDSDGRLTTVNNACLEMFGLSDIAQIEWPRLFDDPYVPAEAKERLRQGEVVRYEVTFDFEEVKRLNLYKTTRSGMAHFDVLITPLGPSQGRPLSGYLLQLQDITERKRAEEALRHQEQYFRSLIENASDAIAIVNGDGIVRYQSPSYERVLGYRPEQEIGRSMFDNIHPDDMTCLAGEFAGLLQDPGGTIRVEVRFQHKDGPWHTIEAAGTNLLHHPAVGGIVVNFRDITDRKLAEEEIVRRHQELTALHHILMAITQTLNLQEVLDEIVSQAGAALDSEYTSIVTVNEDGSLGIDSEDFQGIAPLTIRARPDGVTRSVITTGQPVVVNDAEVYESTNPILISAGIKSYAAAPIKTKDATIGVLFVHSRQPNAFADRLGLLTDLASQAAIAMENARLYKEASTVSALREADRLKTELLANVSHELRTPLASIKGYCTSMLYFYDRLSDEDKRDSLHEINQASDRLTELIENLLQLSRLEAAGLHADKEPTKIESIISRAVEDMEQKATGHHLVTHFEESLPVVEADPGRIRQVLDNLLSNAVKYSPEGTEISVRCESKGQELVVSVRDQGIGIVREDMDKVFDRFYQSTPGLCQNGGGAGLGLTICKRIVEAHGGRIWAESKPGKGSTFVFTLPLTAEGKF